MNKRENALLERAFSAEIEAALSKSGWPLPLMQTRSTLADKLVADGLLHKVSERMHGPWPCTIEGYALTKLGRLTYCMNCDGDEPDGAAR